MHTPSCKCFKLLTSCWKLSSIYLRSCPCRSSNTAKLVTNPSPLLIRLISTANTFYVSKMTTETQTHLPLPRAGTSFLTRVSSGNQGAAIKTNHVTPGDLSGTCSFSKGDCPSCQAESQHLCQSKPGIWGLVKLYRERMPCRTTEG